MNTPFHPLPVVGSSGPHILEVAFRLISNNHNIGSMLRVVLSSAYQHMGSKIQHQNSPSMKHEKSLIVAPFPCPLLPFFFFVEERTWEWMVNFDVESLYECSCHNSRCYKQAYLFLLHVYNNRILHKQQT